MRAFRDTVLEAVMGVFGVFFGLLSAIGLAVAAVIPAFLGLLAFLLSPLRALAERLRRAGS